MTIPEHAQLYRPGLTYHELRDLRDTVAAKCGFILDKPDSTRSYWLHGETSYGTIARVNDIIDGLKDDSTPAGRWLHSVLHDLWLILNDMHGPECTMFSQLVDVIGAVLHGGQVEPVPHAHISVHSTDCDGPHYYSDVQVLRSSGHPDGRFSIRDLIRQAFPIVDGVTLHITEQRNRLPDGVEDFDSNLITAHWGHETDEGGTGTEILGCLNDCDLDESSQRDVFAERMGY